MAEPHPDMKIKVAAFTGSEKSSNNILHAEYTTLSVDMFNELGWISISQGNAI